MANWGIQSIKTQINTLYLSSLSFSPNSSSSNCIICCFFFVCTTEDVLGGLPILEQLCACFPWRGPSRASVRRFVIGLPLTGPLNRSNCSTLEMLHSAFPCAACACAIVCQPEKGINKSCWAARWRGSWLITLSMFTGWWCVLGIRISSLTCRLLLKIIERLWR